MEQQNKVKILVAIHKPDKVYGDKVYMPIQVGKSLSEFNLGFQGDNTGDNISEMNSMFCELTAHYWAWKNLKDVDYIGLCHYRRYFARRKYINTLGSCITEKEIRKILKQYDVILPQKNLGEYNELVSRDFWNKYHYEKDWKITEKVC